MTLFIPPVIIHFPSPVFYYLLLQLIFIKAPFIGFSQTEKSIEKKSFLQNVSAGTRFYYGSYITPKAKSEYTRDSYASFGEIYFQ